MRWVRVHSRGFGEIANGALCGFSACDRAGRLLGGNPVGLAAARTGKFQLCNPCRCV